MGLLDSDIRRLLESFPGVIWATDRHLCASIVFGADLDALGLSADDVSGRELAEQLVAERPEVRILFTSGYPADAVLRRGIAHAEAAYIEKPYLPDDLARKVREVLDA